MWNQGWGQGACFPPTDPWALERDQARLEATRRSARDEVHREQVEREDAAKAAMQRGKEEEELRKEADKRAVAEFQKKEGEEKEIAKEYNRKKKEKEEKKDEEYKTRLARDLLPLGYTQTEIDAITDKDKRGNIYGHGYGYANDEVVVAGSHSDGYRQYGQSSGSSAWPVIKRQDIARETLEHYNLPWKYDASGDYIIIEKEMSVRSTDVLFKHTEKCRRGGGSGTRLAIEPDRRGRDGDRLMLVRSKSRSKSRGKSPSGRERLAAKLLGL